MLNMFINLPQKNPDAQMCKNKQIQAKNSDFQISGTQKRGKKGYKKYQNFWDIKIGPKDHFDMLNMFINLSQKNPDATSLISSNLDPFSKDPLRAKKQLLVKKAIWKLIFQLKYLYN